MQKLCVVRARGPRSGPLFTFMYNDMSATIWNTNWGCLGTSNVVHLPFQTRCYDIVTEKGNDNIFLLSVALRDDGVNCRVIVVFVIGVVTDLYQSN